ncbi:MAG: hypothetical protein ACYC1D_02560 [Acidimicrobiales bacterium]
MTSPTKAASPPSPNSETSLAGLRANCFAGLVMLLVELALGVAVNLTAKLPATDTGRSLPAAFAASITGGPVVLSAHAVLSTLLVATGVAAVATRRPLLIAATAVALASIVAAWLSGARFVGAPSNAASRAAAFATLAYALVLFVSPAPASLPKATP